MNEINSVSADVVDCAIRMHKELGPGLLESVYETVLAGALERRGYAIDRQMPVEIEFDGLRFPMPFESIF